LAKRNLQRVEAVPGTSRARTPIDSYVCEIAALLYGIAASRLPLAMQMRPDRPPPPRQSQ
jgi:hypothetical protein